MERFIRVWIAAALAACAGLEPVSGDAGVLGRLEAGSRTMGPLADTVLATMRQPLVVIALDAAGVPVGNLPVEWEALDGAAVSDHVMPTDAGGESIVSLILGPTVGRYRARAHVPGFTGSPIEFAATAHPGNPVAIEKVRGDSLEVAAGASVVHTVRVRDDHGNGTHGTWVAWEVSDGGSVSWLTSVTGKGGFAEMTHRTADSAGWQHATARAMSVPGTAAVVFATRARR